MKNLNGMAARMLSIAALTLMFLAPAMAFGQSTVPSSGALCTMIAPVPAVVNLTKAAQVYVNAGFSSTDGKLFSGQIIVMVAAGTDYSLSAGCAPVKPSATNPAPVQFPAANMCVAPYVGITRDGRTVTGTLTVVESDPILHTGYFTLNERVASTTAADTVLVTGAGSPGQPCFAHVVAPK